MHYAVVYFTLLITNSYPLTLVIPLIYLTIMQVSVAVEMHYAVVYFTLLITNSDDGFEGSFNTLRIQSHASAALIRGVLLANSISY